MQKDAQVRLGVCKCGSIHSYMRGRNTPAFKEWVAVGWQDSWPGVWVMKTHHLFVPGHMLTDGVHVLALL